MQKIYDEIIDLTKKLIRFSSTYDRPDELQKTVDFCADYFSDELVVRKYVYNNKPSIVIGTHDTREFDVLLNGHVDVVQAVDKDFSPTEKDGKLFGRGALDMKGPVAVLMTVVQHIKDINPDISVGLMLTTDEEVGGPDGVGYLVDTEGYSAKVVLVPDGGEIDRIVTAQKGAIHFKLTAAGVAAHSSRPWIGKNAIEVMTACYADLQKSFPKPKSETDWKTSITMTTIRAGEAMNMVPDECVAGLNLRYTEEKTTDQWIKMVQDICKKHTVQADVEIAAPMCFTDEHNSYVQQFKAATEKVLGRDARFGVETGASDARYFSSQSMPVIISNPTGDNIHNGGEYVEIASLHQYFDIVKSFLQNVGVVDK